MGCEMTEETEKCIVKKHALYELIGMELAFSLQSEELIFRVLN